MANTLSSGGLKEAYFGSSQQKAESEDNAVDNGFLDLPLGRHGQTFPSSDDTVLTFDNLNGLESDLTLTHADYLGAFHTFEALTRERYEDKVTHPHDDLHVFEHYDQCDSYSTRYSEAAYDAELKNNSAMMLKFDTLTESVLKQLETPVLEPKTDVFTDVNLCRLADMDPKLLESLCNAGINIREIVSPKPANGSSGYGGCGEGNYDSGARPAQKQTSMPHLDIGSNDVERAYSQEDNTSDHKANFGLNYKLCRTARRRGKRSEDCEQPVLTRGQSEISAIKYFAANAHKAPANKCKSMLKPMHATVAPAWVKNSILGDKVSNNISAIAKDQAGCRMLQKLLESEDQALINSVLEGVCKNLFELMTDPFGNYLCQKLMSVCCENNLTKIIDSAGKSLVDVALNMHGTRALQKLIEVLRTPEHIRKVTHVLSAGVVQLVTDLNGNHVIQKCLSSLTAEDCEFIYQAVIKNCVCLATHRHGCCVMQRCIDAANERQRKQLVEVITTNVLRLVEDAYGNYVIQYTLKLKDNDINMRIVNALAPKATLFAQQKFSSNVVERCLIICPPDLRSILIERFIKAPFDVLKELILHPFGNYVIQRVLNVAQPDELGALLNRIKPHIDELKNASSGKRIAAKITRKHYNEVNAAHKEAHRTDQQKLDFSKGAKSNAHASGRNNRDIAGDLLRKVQRSTVYRGASPNNMSDNGTLFQQQSFNNMKSNLADGLSSMRISRGTNFNASEEHYQGKAVRASSMGADNGNSGMGPVSLEMLNSLFSRTLTIGSDPASLSEYFNPGFPDGTPHKT
ncbi:pumilio-family RNA binding repeat containing protein, putative [Babesia bigemina]|uniref:Pumilio-family RNA binding repeat containing protein, putative n=1 Tax=Babesia bigemina TaxID=5866 RepID=A0A061DBQ7_BABBI|nr:pumilio-family RNA binding repeat containing protein, putative [Babesia bigemina]CDR95185.1 pumilio-family RNA binding repeat containing protein, putative [Babesia bigemina]|eukprot:XP_012767371.1 pumilio-family RNA binding repeat containing protein, putative [Babesia bigemina]